jgi:hypothetical protein
MEKRSSPRRSENRPRFAETAMAWNPNLIDGRWSRRIGYGLLLLAGTPRV